jgi:hypothetical protein
MIPVEPASVERYLKRFTLAGGREPVGWGESPDLHDDSQEEIAAGFYEGTV